MGKNIILCSDGTGNQGGVTPDSNVFKLYNAVKINKSAKNDNEENKETFKEQVVFYDNGVGTSSFKPMKALGGGMGVGFEDNVLDLYEFLGRNYREGDDIYIFGFSRGAATVRAFAGMIEHCGLVVKHKNDEKEMDEDVFDQLIKDAMAAYKKGKLERDQDHIMKRVISKNFKDADDFRKNHAYKHDEYAPDGRLHIEVMGIWDTVSSLGTPQIPWLDTLINVFLPHRFYDLSPDNCVKNVYHAMAIDDERRTFWPLVWNEKMFDGEGKKIEQVWFTGMHSNVGGGYDRHELSNITFDWMMERLEGHANASKPRNGGLELKEDVITGAREDANPFGKMYDSRDGLAVYYRYSPRPIQKLCDNILNSRIKIHDSVIRRMRYWTAGYSPSQLPEEFEVVSTREPGTNPATPESFERVFMDMKS